MIEDFRFWPIRSELLLSTSQQPDSRFFPFLSRHYRADTLDHNTFLYNEHFTLKTVSISNKTYIQKWKIIVWTLLTWTQCISLASWWPSGSTKTFSVFMKLWFSLVFHIIIFHNFLRFIFGINLFARLSGFLVGDHFVW